MTKRIAVLNGGGHISSFQVGMQEIVREATARGYEVVGFVGGYQGLATGEYVPLTTHLLDPNMAGTPLGSTRDKVNVERSLETMRRLGVDGLIVMGGNDHLSEAQELYKAGAPVVGWPKTMDNDLSGTHFTLGYPTAVDVVARRVRNAHTGAFTNKRIYFMPVFGRNADWVVAAACMWGGGDFLVGGEKYKEGQDETRYPFQLIVDKACAAYEANGTSFGRPFAVVPVSEGADIGGLESHLRKDQVDAHGNIKLDPNALSVLMSSAWREFAPPALRDSVAGDVITYEMRDGPPTDLDRMYAGLAGIKSVQLIADGNFGACPVFRFNAHETAAVDGVDVAPLAEVSVQRFLRPEGFVDYDNLTVNSAFEAYYRDLFGPVPEKDTLVPCLPTVRRE